MTTYSSHIQRLPARRSKYRRIAPLAIFFLAWQHRALIYRLARRDVELRYRGSVLGILWSILVPLLMLGVYTLIFNGIFKNNWPVPPGGKGSYFLILFMGLILLNFFSDCVGRAPTLMMANVSYIKKVVFPLEILGIISITGALFDLIVATTVLLIIYFLTLGVPSATALLLPVTIFPLLLVTLGLTWFLSSLGVYLRDLRQVVGVVLTAAPFLCPLFYPFKVFAGFGPIAMKLLFLNPLTTPVFQSRHVLFFNQRPSWTLWLAYTIGSYLFASAGLLWFSYSRKGFADVV